MTRAVGDVGRGANLAIRACLVVLVAALTACTAPDTSGDNRVARQTEAERSAQRFMVSSANPIATETGLEVLRDGGSAIDAAIAVLMVLGFVEAPETGIGGGGFLLYHNAATGTQHVYDGREVAPASASPDRFTVLGQQIPLWLAVPAGKAVGVPGLVPMLGRAHDEHGTRPWAELLQPAIALAENGVDMPTRLQGQILEDHSLKLFADTRRYFHAQAREETPRLHNPAYAQTLRDLAREGPQAWSTGPIADAIAARAQARWPMRGDLQRSDFENYRAVKRDALCGNYREWTVCGLPPPSSGALAVLQILGMLERFDLAQVPPGSARAHHLIAEASRLAFADRYRHVGDPAFTDVPVADLIDPDYLAARSALIDPVRAMYEAMPGEPGERAVVPGAEPADEAETTGTSHFTIVDGDGNLVALTSSVEAPFGARMMTNGFLLNNQLTDFTFDPDYEGALHPNAVEPGKRPRSSMSPIMVFDAQGNTRLVIGSRGGARIIGYVVKSLIGVLDWELDVQEAIALPNMVHRGDVLELERGTPVERQQATLEAMGHDVDIVRMTSGLHGIERIPGGWRGGADPRLDGVARGE